jgi:RsiW-degrading membrane proteinase PrsW (M82 family)
MFLVWIRGLGFVVAAAIFWLQYFDLKDYLHPEPRRLLVLSCFLGAAAAFAALFLYWLVGALGGPEYPGSTHSQILAYCFLVSGPIEEGTKFVMCRAFIFRLRYFDEPIDGLIYASAVSIGFAGIESLIYTPFLPWPELAARAITSPLTHSLFASAWGFGAGIAFFRARKAYSRFLWQMCTVFLAMITHGFYDYALLSHHATFMASGLVLVLWTFLIVYARRLVQSRPLVQL